MRTLIIIGLTLLFAAHLFAGIENPTEPQDNAWFYDEVPSIPDAAVFENNPAKKIEGITDYAAIAPPSEPIFDGDIGYGGPGNNEPLWGTDILVQSQGSPTWGEVNTDYDYNEGYIYVSTRVPDGGTDDSVYTYRSNDGGVTWNYHMVQVGGASTGGIADHSLVVGSDGGGTWIYSFVLYDGSGASGGIWLLRTRPDFSQWDWIQIVVAGDTINSISADRNIESPEHIFLGYWTTIDNIRLGSSSDAGATWGNWRYTSSGSNDVSVAAGGDGYVYIAFAEDTVEITVGRYTNNLISPSFNFEQLDAGGEGDWYPSVAGARTTPGASQSAICMYRHRHSNGNFDIHYGYTTDGGASWSDAPWPPSNNSHNTWLMRWPFARYSYGDGVGLFRAVASIPETSTSFDSLRYGYAYDTDPTTWAGEGVYNDHRITSEFGGRVSHSPDNNGGYIVYREYGSPNIWFDGYAPGGVGEGTTQPVTKMKLNASSLTRGTVTINFTLPKQGNVSLKAYDVTGREVGTILNGSYGEGQHSYSWNGNLSTGQYFLRLKTEQGAETQSVIVVK